MTLNFFGAEGSAVLIDVAVDDCRNWTARKDPGHMHTLRCKIGGSGTPEGWGDWLSGTSAANLPITLEAAENPAQFKTDMALLPRKKVSNDFIML